MENDFCIGVEVREGKLESQKFLLLFKLVQMLCDQGQNKSNGSACREEGADYTGAPLVMLTSIQWLLEPKIALWFPALENGSDLDPRVPQDCIHHFFKLRSEFPSSAALFNLLFFAMDNLGQFGEACEQPL